MQRTTKTYTISNADGFKIKMLNWLHQFNIFCLLDSNNYNFKHKQYEMLVAAGAIKIFAPQNEKLTELQKFTAETNDWIFGHVSYDFKNKIEALTSARPDSIGFADIQFFIPETVIKINDSEIEISSYNNPDFVIDEIIQSSENIQAKELFSIPVQPRISKEEYLEKIENLKTHIKLGDCYEINFCQEFYAENAKANPTELFYALNNKSPNPFAAYYRNDDKYCICASPERFIQKTNDAIISQPIKGTLKRTEKNFINKVEQETLHNSIKDRTENVMIVDLVRNDLNKICKTGTIHPSEMYGIQSFPQVHQMVSTIEGTLKNDINFADIIRATFPMGSMTGAPKKRVMELSEQYEATARGLYSGTIGYISPDKNFDFNVVIRSIMYNTTSQYLNFHVGGAITFNSNPEDEYNECLAKAEAMMQVLK